LQTLALDMMHADFDQVTGLLGYPVTVQTVATEAHGRGSAAEVALQYPAAVARCTSSSLMHSPTRCVEAGAPNASRATTLRLETDSTAGRIVIRPGGGPPATPSTLLVTRGGSQAALSGRAVVGADDAF